MLGINFTRWLVALCLALPLAMATPSADLTPRGILFAPMHVNHTEELRCVVPPGIQHQWRINRHPINPEEHIDTIFINTTDTISVFRIGDAGLDTFGTVHGSAVLTIECAAVNYLFRFTHYGSEQRRVIRFERPDQPGNITVFPRSGRMLLDSVRWERPENMIEKVPLTYTVFIQDLLANTDGDRFTYYENVTRQRIKTNFPECFNITVWASNEAGTSDPAFHPSSTPCSPTEDTPHTTLESLSTTATEERSGALSSYTDLLVGLAAILLVVTNY